MSIGASSAISASAPFAMYSGFKHTMPPIQNEFVNRFMEEHEVYMELPCSCGFWTQTVAAMVDTMSKNPGIPPTNPIFRVVLDDFNKRHIQTLKAVTTREEIMINEQRTRVTVFEFTEPKPLGAAEILGIKQKRSVKLFDINVFFTRVGVEAGGPILETFPYLNRHTPKFIPEADLARIHLPTSKRNFHTADFQPMEESSSTSPPPPPLHGHNQHKWLGDQV